MIDPATFRRMRPNYLFSSIQSPIDSRKEEDEDAEHEPEDSEQDSSCSEKESSSSDSESGDDSTHSPERGQRVEPIREPRGRTFSDDNLLLASPVVLGFSFADKLWLEFSVSGLQDFEYNEGAFESLMLPEKQKDIVQALVESHIFNAAKVNHSRTRSCDQLLTGYRASTM